MNIYVSAIKPMTSPLLLMTGGELIAVTLAVDDEGQYMGNCNTIKRKILEVFTVLWKEMLQEDRITQVRNALPTWQTAHFMSK